MKNIIERLSNIELRATGGFALFTIILWIIFILDIVLNILEWVVK